ncbi:hypothetical protein BKA64DRAFT_766451 [Cadophora sp. MPI-SDFR-AT-0126]|nr:hypothetical protein BKA64DRAFT_766451 [Leotiomycetes sp. MPI-SDFR-AT-0126]
MARDRNVMHADLAGNDNTHHDPPMIVRPSVHPLARAVALHPNSVPLLIDAARLLLGRRTGFWRGLLGHGSDNRYWASSSHRSIPWNTTYTRRQTEDFCEVPSVVSLQQGNPPTLTFGYEASYAPSTYRFANIKALINSEPPESLRLFDLLAKFEPGSAARSPGHERPDLGGLSSILPGPPHRSMYSRRFTTAASCCRYDSIGWDRVETVTEAEAAADVILRSRPGSFFDDCGTSVCIVDLGGMTQDWAFYRVRKVEGRIVKEELVKSVGGYGGMALVDELAREFIHEKKDDQGLSQADIDALSKEFFVGKMGYTSGVLVLKSGRLSLQINEVIMEGLFNACLEPIIDQTMDYSEILQQHNIKIVFLVGGTSTSKWLRSPLEKAFGSGVKLIFPLETISTMIATGANLAWSPNDLTTARFSAINLGRLVTRSYEYSFQDRSLWGQSKKDYDDEKVIEVIELIKTKGLILDDRDHADWHWVELPTERLCNFSEVLADTYV